MQTFSFCLPCLLLTLLATPAESSLVKFEYDPAGNMISEQDKYYEYNDANQLVRVRKDAPDGEIIAEYVYDYQGQRVKKTENGVTTYYVGKHYEERKGATVNEKTNYFFANNQRIAKSSQKNKAPPELSYYLNNHLGSADVIINEQGTQTERLRYLPFGGYRTFPKEKHTFTGKERDEVTDNYYFEARYYNPNIRRFTQADTIVPDLYDPQSLNRYAYARNSPVVYTDPSGHFIFAAIAIGWAAFEIGSTIYDAVCTYNDLRNEQLTDFQKTESVAFFVAGLEAPGSGRLWKKGLGFVSNLKSVGKVKKIFQNAYDLAKSGGKHSGFLNNYLKVSSDSIRKGISSLEEEIYEHKDKIKNPKKYIEKWDELDARQREHLINSKWPSDIKRQSEQIEILEGILKRRK
ncbi:MAG: RHS repeat-associated core domain-containing protein [Candidatus Electrothrix scaldis]|nr:MAG: RHS repeat-associated core domain-containing protein [Candidatus Electrothrix sp. GW3-3]